MKRLVLALALTLPGVAAAQQTPTPPERTVTVTAMATVEREPERALLLLAVESTGTTAQQASQANAARMDALIAALRTAGHLRVRTCGPCRTELHPGVRARSAAAARGTAGTAAYHGLPRDQHGAGHHRQRTACRPGDQ